MEKPVVRQVSPKWVLISKAELREYLDSEELDIIWAVLGEKVAVGGDNDRSNFFNIFSGVYNFGRNGTLEGCAKMSMDN